MKNVFDLAQEDTSLKKVSHKEYAGRCPACGGSDRFHVQPYGKDGGSWMCRNCWNPTEYLPEKGRKRGWGDGIDYLRHYRNMSFIAAKSFLSDELDTAIERAERIHNKSLEQYGKPPNQVWQDRAARYTAAAQARLWTPEGSAALEYLLSRGLTEDTIEKAGLGYARYIVTENGEKLAIPCVVIPWYADGVYWRINLRDIRADRPEDAPRYFNVPESSNAGLYLGDSLKLKRPTFIVEGEIDALSIAQESGDSIAVVATGSTSGSRIDKWAIRLAQVPSVFVAYDNEPQGEKDAQYWLHILSHNAARHRPLIYKDANAMLVADKDLLRAWVASATYEDEEEDSGSQVEEPPVAAADISSTHTATAAAQEQELDTTTTWLCSQCGIDLTSIESACYSEDGLAYCDYNQDTGAAYCSRATRTPYRSQEQVVRTANRLAQELDADCSVTPLEPSYTLEQHIERLKQEALAAQALAAEPSELERAIISKLQGYHLFIGDVCQCGCRLKWPVAGGMFIECARCEPGGLWSTPTIELLRSLPFERLKRAG